nr:PREDICTED: uncharacterized protein LOC107075843 [Lepisosteus oculatus]
MGLLVSAAPGPSSAWRPGSDVLSDTDLPPRADTPPAETLALREAGVSSPQTGAFSRSVTAPQTGRSRGPGTPSPPPRRTCERALHGGRRAGEDGVSVSTFLSLLPTSLPAPSSRQDRPEQDRPAVLTRVSAVQAEVRDPEPLRALPGETCPAFMSQKENLPPPPLRFLGNQRTLCEPPTGPHLKTQRRRIPETDARRVSLETSAIRDFLAAPPSPTLGGRRRRLAWGGAEAGEGVPRAGEQEEGGGDRERAETDAGSAPQGAAAQRGHSPSRGASCSPQGERVGSLLDSLGSLAVMHSKLAETCRGYGQGRPHSARRDCLHGDSYCGQGRHGNHFHSHTRAPSPSHSHRLTPSHSPSHTRAPSPSHSHCLTPSHSRDRGVQAGAGGPVQGSGSDPAVGSSGLGSLGNLGSPPRTGAASAASGSQTGLSSSGRGSLECGGAPLGDPCSPTPPPERGRGSQRSSGAGLAGVRKGDRPREEPLGAVGSLAVLKDFFR